MPRLLPGARRAGAIRGRDLVSICPGTKSLSIGDRMRRFAVYLSVAATSICMGHHAIAEGRCGGNTHELIQVWGQGFGPRQFAALAAAKADFNSELAKTKAALSTWANQFSCPNHCRYRFILNITGRDYKETPRGFKGDRGFMEDVTEDYTITVHCFPISVEKIAAVEPANER